MYTGIWLGDTAQWNKKSKLVLKVKLKKNCFKDLKYKNHIDFRIINMLHYATNAHIAQSLQDWSVGICFLFFLEEMTVLHTSIKPFLEQPLWI